MESSPFLRSDVLSPSLEPYFTLSLGGREKLQSHVTNLGNKFHQHVIASRGGKINFKDEKIKGKVLSGDIFLGTEALQLG